MKKVLISVACSLIFAGCSMESSEEVKVRQDLNPVRFSVQFDKEILSFPSTKSIPGFPAEPAASKSGDETIELTDLCSAIEYVVFSVDGTDTTNVRQRRFLKTDDDFGIVYDSLPKGKYIFTFMAHSSPGITLDGRIMSFDKVTDTFYKRLDLTVEPASSVQEDILLERIVSRIDFYATDQVKPSLTRFDAKVSNRGDKVNVVTGCGISNPTEFVLSHIFAAADQTNKPLHSFFAFPDVDSTRISATLLAYEGENVIRQRTINDINPQRNKILRYSGRLYSRAESDDQFTIAIYGNGEWGETTEVPIGD